MFSTFLGCPQCHISTYLGEERGMLRQAGVQGLRAPMEGEAQTHPASVDRTVSSVIQPHFRLPQLACPLMTALS